MMSFELNIIFRLFNCVVTLAIATLLLRIYRKINRRFYLYWGVGYVFYGVNIFLRLFTPTEFDVSTLGVIAFLLMMIGFTFIVAGVGELVNQTRTLLVSTLSLLLIPLIQIILGREWVSFAFLVVLTPYLFMGLSLMVLNWKYGVDVQLQIAGWFNLFFVNLGFITKLVDPGFTDLTSTVAKVVIFMGMTQPRFSFLEDDLKQFLMGGIPVEYAISVEGNLSMVNQANISREKDRQWIKEKIISNSRKGIRTILLSIYDLITPKEIFEQNTEENLYFVRVLSGSRSSLNTFEEKIMSINDDLNQLDILFTDVINYSNEKKIPCEIILYTLSHLIHTHGWRRVYSFMTSKNPVLKSSQVQLTCFYDKKSHEVESDIIKFERLADSVMSV